MLAISDAAADVIKQLVASSQIPDEGGIRISAEPVDNESARLDLSLAPSPELGDAIVDDKGAHVFIEERISPFLDDKVLDADVEADRVAFSIMERGQNFSGNGQPRDIDPRRIL